MKTTDYTDKRKTGQALLELAIFGSIFIMLLGVLINYGLKYNYQQQVMQQTYRKALKGAAESAGDGKPMSVMYVLGRDEYIPNPSQLFGLGSVTPISASAGVIRNYHMQDAPVTKDELPQVTVDINGQINSYKTAGFRYETNVPESLKDKYAEIYGPYNVCWDEECGASAGECLEETVNPYTGETSCAKPTANIKIIDPCAGEIVDYSTAVRQCRQIVDVEACKTECYRGAKDDSDRAKCDAACAEVMNPPNQNDNQYYSEKGGAWYCANYTETDTTNHKYTFPVLNQLFNFAIASNKPKVMGPSQDYTQQTKIYGASLNKKETPSGIGVSEQATYKDTIHRNIVYNNALNANGVSTGAVNITIPAVVSTTKITTCEYSADCPYGYKLTTCSGDDCSQTAGKKTWQTNW
jgi:hypothetical protein